MYSGTEIGLEKNYQLITQIGEGAFAKVWKAKCGQELYALKFIDQKMIQFNGLEQYLQAEIKIMGELSNYENIVKLYEFKRNFIINSKKYSILVLEYCSQGSLQEYHDKNPIISKEMAWSIFEQIIKGLVCLHKRGIIHRDLKKQNILIHKIGNQTIIKIADFGISKKGRQDIMTNTMCGTLQYMAIQVLMNQKYNYKCDVWSAGVIFYSLLYNCMPFKNGFEAENDILNKIQNGFKLKNVNVGEGEQELFEKIFRYEKDRLDFTQILQIPAISKKMKQKNINIALQKKHIQVMDEEMNKVFQTKQVRDKAQIAAKYELSLIEFLKDFHKFIKSQFQLKDKFKILNPLDAATLYYINKKKEQLKSNIILGDDFFKINLQPLMVEGKNQAQKASKIEQIEIIKKKYIKSQQYSRFIEQLQQLYDQFSGKQPIQISFQQAISQLIEAVEVLKQQTNQKIAVIAGIYLVITLICTPTHQTFQQRFQYVQWKQNPEKTLKGLIQWLSQQSYSNLKCCYSILRPEIKKLQQKLKK